jgi:pyruvate/2-oxoglutarate dehydrogenase complex dihydrolipoamide dehydrogenase (E3) component
MGGYDFDIGVLGAGAAGLTVTAGAAQLGAKTLLIEKESKLGGDCLHFGCVPSKTLIKSARVYQQIKNASRYGLPPVSVEPVDFSKVVARIRSVIATIQQHDSVERFCGLGAQVEFGQPAFVDEHTVQLNGKRYSAKSWVVATGSSPSAPPLEGLSDTPFITNKEIFSLDRLPDSMIVLGGGPIAVEMAQAFNRLGSKVSVVQRSGQILSKEDKDMADQIMAAMETEGVRFYLNAKVLGVREHGGGKEVILKAGDEQLAISAETILVAMGRTPNINELGLQAAGVEYSKRGIGVDDRLRTSQKHIYAAGDVTGSFLFTHAAGYEGGIVISNAVFRLPRKVNYTYMPWCTYTSPELASIGMNEKSAAAAGIRYSVWTEEFRSNDRSLAEGEEIGWVKMLLDEKERPLGVQILGPQAGDLLAEWVAVFNGRVKLSALASAVHPYPTLGEINKRVAGSFLSTKIFSDKVKKGLKFFFHLKGRACEVD